MGHTTTDKFSLNTICRHTGKVCQQCCNLAQGLEWAIHNAENCDQKGFEASGYVRLTGCDRGCLLGWKGNIEAVYLFADIPPKSDLDALTASAQKLLSSRHISSAETDAKCSPASIQILPFADTHKRAA